MEIHSIGIATPAPAPGPAAPGGAGGALIAATAAPGAASVRQAADAANQAMQSMGSGVEFSVDAQSGHTIVRVVDTATHQIIRQMPSDEMIAISRALDRLHGLLLSSKA